MSGAAFAHAAAPKEPTLNVSRMSPGDYTKLKTIYLAKLQEYFPSGTVACLTEAPEKTDFGDMDIYIAIDQRVDFVDMANQMGATGVICHSAGLVQKCTLGVLKDGTASTRSVVKYKHSHENSGGLAKVSATFTEEEYAQIDIEVIQPKLLEWHIFYSSYGDMIGLLGHIVHNLGFTVSDRGLWLRMKELDYSKTVSHVNIPDSDGMMFLSRDTEQVMKFLGLSTEKYYQGLKTLAELYEWLGACRLLNAEAVKVKRDNSHERNREQKRVVYYNFFHEWLPAHMDMNDDQDKTTQTRKLQQLRQKHLEEAVDQFSKRQEHDQKHDGVVLQVKNAVAANLLKLLAAQYSEKEGKHLNEIMRAFRRYIGFGDEGQPYILSTPHSDAQSQLYLFLAEDWESLKDARAVSAFVEQNWEELRSLERQRVKVAA